MKTININRKDMKKIFALFLMIPLFFACSEDIMDEINEDQNNALVMDARNLLPDLTLKSGFESTATDLAWYATVYIEHNAGTWNQSHQADARVGQTANSLLNNSWNSLYDVMNISKTIIDMTDPETGAEPNNLYARGVAQILLAYNLAITTDFWGEIPYAEAFQGFNNLNPAYQKQSDIYPIIQQLLDDGIVAMTNSTVSHGARDFIYSSKEEWVKAAWSLKARFHMRLTNINAQNASTQALAAAANGFTSADDEMMIGGFDVALPGSNPWGEFWYNRDHLSVSTTIFDLMAERNDSLRMQNYFSATTRASMAPIGAAQQTQGGYAQSLYTSGWDAMALPVIMFTYHELKFIEAEAKFRTGAADWQDALEAAVEAAFEFHGAEVGTYFDDEVLPLLTAGNELKEIMTQKYIAFYDREAIEAYNDYRRTGFPEMKNPNNATVGFVNRAPFPVSEVSSNSANVPDVNIFTDKVWWALGAGAEKL